MNARTPPKSNEELLAALDRLDESVPMEEPVVGQILKEAGIDARAELARALAMVDTVERRHREERFARADADRQADLRKLSHGGVSRSRTDNLARLRRLQAAAPRGAELHANFKNLETISDQDLDRIVAEFEHLLAEEDDK